MFKPLLSRFTGILVLLSFLSANFAFAETNRFENLRELYKQDTDGKDCKSLLTKSIERAIVITSVAGLGGLSAGLSGVGAYFGLPHLVSSIFFDYDTILAGFPREEQKLFDSPAANQKKIIDLLNKKLSKHFNHSPEAMPIFKPRMASEYFLLPPPDNDVCRHKAMVMAAVLNQAGIKAVPTSGFINAQGGRGGHVWVYLPDTDEVADPTAGVHVSREVYEKHYGAVVNNGAIYAGRALGWAVR